MIDILQRAYYKARFHCFENAIFMLVPNELSERRYLMTHTALQSGAYLHHVAFESENPLRLAKFYAAAMQMDVISETKDEVRCEGPSRRMIILSGENKKLAYAGFACRSIDAFQGLRQRVQTEGIELAASPSPYFETGAFSLRDPDGNLVCFGLSRPEKRKLSGLHGPTQHLTLATHDIQKIIDFYQVKLGFQLVGRVLQSDGALVTAFMTSNHEHHTLACFKSERQGVDHHSYEVGEWNLIRDWCDHFSSLGIEIFWGPGRHGPGNNLFAFMKDPDDNWIEISAELELIFERDVIDWPQEPRTLNKWGRALMRS